MQRWIHQFGPLAGVGSVINYVLLSFCSIIVYRATYSSPPAYRYVLSNESLWPKCPAPRLKQRWKYSTAMLPWLFFFVLINQTWTFLEVFLLLEIRNVLNWFLQTCLSLFKMHYGGGHHSLLTLKCFWLSTHQKKKKIKDPQREVHIRGFLH